jgi:hypothetical protein
MRRQSRCRYTFHLPAAPCLRAAVRGQTGDRGPDGVGVEDGRCCERARMQVAGTGAGRNARVAASVGQGRA